eukprot:2013829-Prymnesium_polylepis.1
MLQCSPASAEAKCSSQTALVIRLDLGALFALLIHSSTMRCEECTLDRHLGIVIVSVAALVAIILWGAECCRPSPLSRRSVTTI